MEAEGSITVEAVNPTAPFNGMTFEACGREFLLGPNGPCTYCPTFVPEGECPAGDKTILFPGSTMVSRPEYQSFKEMKRQEC